MNQTISPSYNPNEKYYDVEAAYSFPYHHLAFRDENGTGTIFRTLNWGLEYLSYQEHVKNITLGLNPKSVLEIGCGDGFFIGGLPKTIERRVGVDLSEPALRFARAFYPTVEFFNHSASDLDEEFDVTASIGVMEHVPDHGISTFLQTTAARTKLGGYAIICVPTPIVPPEVASSAHYRHYNRAIFEECLLASKAPLEIVKVDYVYRLQPWFELFRRILNNRHWIIDFAIIRRFIWNYVWNNLLIGTEKDSKHIVVTMRRID